MPEIHERRREQARRRIAEAGADAALITGLVNVCYLTGLESSYAALLLPADGPAVLATDSRYEDVARRECPDVELLAERMIDAALVELAARRGAGTLAFEAHVMTVERHAELAEIAGAPAMVPLGRVVEELRIVKDEAEIGRLRTACAITGSAFTAVLDRIRPGMTERELAVLIERAMVDAGAERPAFGPIVASGPNGAIPHHTPAGRTFQPGELITIDCGARYGGYHADMTRTVALGEPAGWQREIYDLVSAAQQAGVTAARAGADVADVDRAARDMISEAGHGDHFRHGLGHGVGLEVHEAPIIGYSKTGKLVERVSVTIEPGIYLPGRGGVRIEDTLVVRGNGGPPGKAGAAGTAEILTTPSKDLLVL
jgi:Xaa-Pro aminopeptidase